MTSLTARNASLAGCSICHLLCRISEKKDSENTFCPRCGAVLHMRKPKSIGRTWALIIAAVILYIPANLFPITRITSFGVTQSDTIISGVVYFIQSGMWLIAAVIFVASVLIPIFKIIILIFLLVSIRHRSEWRPSERARLYRFIEGIGRWSMVDIFVVTILVALVQVGNAATIEAGPGAVFFAAVVIITMVASMSFDPRLIWDEKEKSYE
ncbi:MAG: paraquat-inducible protein A [Deltaproteobacteria bacterium RBG_13_49_15]|nr:MAG: paraquat-inducible protein A [Deltaproteobacteria bacterium RBG_13_49_15]